MNQGATTNETNEQTNEQQTGAALMTLPKAKDVVVFLVVKAVQNPDHTLFRFVVKIIVNFLQTQKIRKKKKKKKQKNNKKKEKKEKKKKLD